MIFLGYLMFEVGTIPFAQIPQLKNENPTETALMQQRRQEASDAGKTLKIRQQWIPLSQIPRHVISAVIVSEDGRFFSHPGFDQHEIRESFKAVLEEMKIVRGGSTITQQLAKNLYLSSSRNPIRKVKELFIAFLLEKHLGKMRILELYLNVIEWGRGIFGIQAAAKVYFRKSVSDVTREEGARLAAVLPNPKRYRPDRDSQYLLGRTRLILHRMNARGSIRYKEVPWKWTDVVQELREILTPS